MPLTAAVETLTGKFQNQHTVQGLEYPAWCVTYSPEEHFLVLELFDRAAVCSCNDSMSQLNLTIDFTRLLIVRFP